MNRIAALVAAAGLMLIGFHAFANAPSDQMTVAQKDQMMKDCLSKQMAANSGMSKADMKKFCKDEMMKPQTLDPTATVGSGGPEVPANH